MPLGTRRAIFLGENGELSIKHITEDYKPFGDQALVKVNYSAINPADIKHSFVGLCGSVAGLEWVGTVVEVGNSTPFKVGQKLFGMSMPGRQRPLYLGAHQDYLIADGTQTTWELPHNISEQDAVSIPHSVGTAIDALFNTLGFGFPAAGLDGRDATGVPILIWGGASVGTAAIQVAKAAGFGPIFTTASPQNHKSLLKKGASQVFDYSSPAVVEDIKRAVAESGKKLTVVFNAVSADLDQLGGSSDGRTARNTPDLARRCVSDDVPAKDLLLSSVLPVEHDPAWKFCIGVRRYGDSFFLGVTVSQDPAFPVRMKKYMDWCDKFRILAAGAAQYYCAGSGKGH